MSRKFTDAWETECLKLFLLPTPQQAKNTYPYRMKFLLTQKLETPLTEEYELPWHPPTCPQDKEAAGFTKKSKLVCYICF